ncbi:hypothetical protein [Aliarcobacter butzleri]|uniref:hypothetical protein n=1 Tax=Aliarcobacter butzleri TaxID=28197 RepID=UPI00189E6465|nr:hypothetical protein [Aliarcobacter butzleri]MBF7065747.1 hypothetical protein [Aliarcobacter butzleri]
MSSKIIPVGFDNITILRGSKYVGLWEWDNCDFEGRTATIKIKNIHPDFKDKKNSWEVGTARVEPLDIDGNPYKGRVEIELTKEETFLLSIPEEEEFLYDEEGGYYSVLNIILDDGTVILSANVKVINSLEVETLDYLVDEKDKAAIINEKLDTIIANNADFVSQIDIHLKTFEEAQVNLDTQTKDITTKHEEINQMKDDVIALKGQVETIFDNFDDRYLGVFDVAPILDNDGEALEVGAIYFDKIDRELKFYNGDSWDSPVGAAQTYARQASQSASDADTSKLATKQIEDNVKLIEEAINKKSNSILDLVVESNTLNDSELATVNYDSQTGVMTFGIPKGKPFTYADFTPEQLDSLQGKDGLSAYDIAVKNGFNGTEQEWLDLFNASPTVEKIPELPISKITNLNTILNQKTNTSDIQNVLNSTATDKPLSANQGRILKEFIDAINEILSSDDTTLDELQEIVNFIKQNKSTLDSLTVDNIAGLSTSLNNKVDKVNGKVLSSNDFTTTEKNKLANIEAGAQTNPTNYVTTDSIQDILETKNFINSPKVPIPQEDMHAVNKKYVDDLGKNIIAFARFDGISTITNLISKEISSVIRLTNGHYRCYFTKIQPDSNYLVLITTAGSYGSYYKVIGNNITGNDPMAKTTTYFDIKVGYVSTLAGVSTAADSVDINCLVIRN